MLLPAGQKEKKQLEPGTKNCSEKQQVHGNFPVVYAENNFFGEVGENKIELFQLI